MTIIAGQTVLLTGASRGIGTFIARALAKEKATIVGVSRSQQGLDKVAAEVKALGGKWIGITHDISQVEELPILVKEINQRVGSIDILINNAGLEIYKKFQDYSTAEMQSVLTVNLMSAMELSRLLLPTMLCQRRGHIVNIASLAGKKGSPYDSIYSASKAGLLMWGDSLRQELVDTGVKVSTICPGYISGQGMFADTGVPAPRLAGISTPADVANAVIQAIKHNQAEAIVNQDPITAGMTKLLMALWQIFPKFGDTVYQWMEVAKLNQLRIENQMQIALRTSDRKLMVTAKLDTEIKKA
ncbi:SDR family NAD(P)-dependent oxidoreductase [Nostocaceae cyanobacterium CENA369]|uniref:SDR family NAD(P)-dependent oxidoreductase n=1 Tax=Dendronalium phyllosphericum CENA369 TaxID=1725256 RepID=A0A8J7LH80_9NOST|nr:SDR family NAD(P)-dependent oxidoreductase [Dendronalium phyllosphericum]MBH8573699.1 SDR family NAD(P)-dependent oxidoreductase [Dendronalium phyllosphericum CENA369]